MKGKDTDAFYYREMQSFVFEIIMYYFLIFGTRKVSFIFYSEFKLLIFNDRIVYVKFTNLHNINNANIMI